MNKFSQEQEESIKSKIDLFLPITEKGITQKELMQRLSIIEDKISKNRLRWYEEHKDKLDYLKWEHITDLQKAFIMMFGHQMEINHKDLNTIPIYDEEQGIFTAYIQAKNFCPYLEAFKRMEIKPDDSVQLCNLVLEKPCQLLIEKVNPKIRFFRNYSHIRPIADYCDERLMIRDYSLIEKLNLLK